MQHGALFDHDGTLVDSESMHFAFWRTVAARHGFTLDAEEYERELVGVPSAENAVYLVRSRALSVTPEELAQEKEATAVAWLKENAFPLLPGALEALQFFADRGVKLAIVTSATRPILEATIRAYDLGRYVQAYVTHEDVVHGKPAPDPYLLGLERIGLSADACVAFEDSVAGSTAAVAAGVPTCAIPPRGARHDHYSHVDFVALSMNEACAWAAARFDL